MFTFQNDTQLSPITNPEVGERTYPRTSLHQTTRCSTWENHPNLTVHGLHASTSYNDSGPHQQVLNSVRTYADAFSNVQDCQPVDQPSLYELGHPHARITDDALYYLEFHEPFRQVAQSWPARRRELSLTVETWKRLPRLCATSPSLQRSFGSKSFSTTASQESLAASLPLPRKTNRTKLHINLAPDQPPTTLGTPRERVYVACIQCRDRKIRCDGARPACYNCGRRANTSDECSYDAAPKRRGPDKTPGTRQRMARDLRNDSNSVLVPTRRRRRRGSGTKNTSELPRPFSGSSTPAAAVLSIPTTILAPLPGLEEFQILDSHKRLPCGNCWDIL